jgi:hypothetical protein
VSPPEKIPEEDPATEILSHLEAALARETELSVTNLQLQEALKEANNRLAKLELMLERREPP